MHQLHNADAWVRALHSRVGFVVNTFAQGQAFLQILPFLPVGVVPQLLHAQSCFGWGWTVGPLAATVAQRRR